MRRFFGTLEKTHNRISDGFFGFQVLFPWVQMKRVCFSLITRRIGVFSGPYFPVFGQNTKNYRVNFKNFPWVFPDFSNFPLIFPVFPVNPECSHKHIALKCRLFRVFSLTIMRDFNYITANIKKIQMKKTFTSFSALHRDHHNKLLK